MKIGAIVELMGKPLLEAIEMAAEMGIEGIQIYGGHMGHGEMFADVSDEYIKQIQDRCAAHGMIVTAVCSDVSPKAFQVPAEAPERIAVTKKIMDSTARLGAKVVTTHIGCIPENMDDPVYPVMVQSLRECAGYALSKGLTLAIETGPELADVLKTFIEQVNSKGLGVNLDPANLLGVSREDPVYAVKTLAPYIVHTHAKDSICTHTGSSAAFYQMRNLDGSVRRIAARPAGYCEKPIGEGAVPWDAYLAALKEIGYDGYLTIEREGGDVEKDVRNAVVFLREKLAKLA